MHVLEAPADLVRETEASPPLQEMSSEVLIMKKRKRRLPLAVRLDKRRASPVPGLFRIIWRKTRDQQEYKDRK